MPIPPIDAAKAELAVIVDTEGGSTEIYLYKDGDDTRPTFIAMSGDPLHRPHIEWLTEAAAERLGVAYRVEEV